MGRVECQIPYHHPAWKVSVPDPSSRAALESRASTRPSPILRPLRPCCRYSCRAYANPQSVYTMNPQSLYTPGWGFGCRCDGREVTPAERLSDLGSACGQLNTFGGNVYFKYDGYLRDLKHINVTYYTKLPGIGDTARAELLGPSIRPRHSRAAGYPIVANAARTVGHRVAVSDHAAWRTGTRRLSASAHAR